MSNVYIPKGVDYNVDTNIDKGETFHHYYINNAYASFFRSIADYFRSDWFDRSSDTIISTYTKAVRHWMNIKKNAGEDYSPNYPFLSMDIGTDLEPDPQAGRFFHQYPAWRKRWATDLYGNYYEPVIYKDDQVLISPIWNRYKGTIELTIWCSSIYEYFDVRQLVFQKWSGLDRIIMPVVVDGCIVLPDELVDWEYTNEYLPVNYPIRWEENKAETKLIKNMNRNKVVYPFSVKPQLRLSSVTSGADKYGGSGDDVAEHRLVIEMIWESYLPTHVGVHSKRGRPGPPSHNISVEMNLSSRSSLVQVPGEDPVSIDGPDSMFGFYGGKKDGVFYSGTMTYKETFNYILSDEEDEKINGEEKENFQIELLEPVEIMGLGLRIYGKFGELLQGRDWRFINNNLIEFYYKQMSSYEVGDSLTFVLYDTSSMTKIVHS